MARSAKNFTNSDIAKLFRSVAAVLQLQTGDNRFRIAAYERAADSIEHATSEVKDLWDDHQLDSLSGIGANMASYLDELFTTGRVRHFQNLLKAYPPALFELLNISGIGPKTALKLVKALGITRASSAVSSLEKAAKKGHIRQIEGFGEDSESSILKSIAEYKGRTRRMLLHQANRIADDLLSYLRSHPEIIQADPLGSLRRQVSTVGDIDISVASNNPVAVIKHFCEFPRKRRVLEAGEHTASLILPNDYQVDLMVQPPESYGSLLQHFTGSKHHNIALREYAMKKGLSLSEYGIKSQSGSLSLIKEGDRGEVHKFPDETSLYNFLGLDYIPPELREGGDEINLAREHKLPRLVELKDIKGDLQLHSSFDIEPSHDLGTSTISDLARKAALLGYEYIGLTEHNPSVSGHTESQTMTLLKSKSDLVAEFNSQNNGVYIFNGLEVDIQPNGALALPEGAFTYLDYVCVSIHSSFSLSRSAMTKRVLSALAHPKARFFAHPTGRLLGEREGVELDWDEIFSFCLSRDKWLEIDAWPNRLDLPDHLVHEAMKKGVKIIIDTDSHSAPQMDYMRYGVMVARRGWATASDIINTRSLKQIKYMLLPKGGE